MNSSDLNPSGAGHTSTRNPTTANRTPPPQTHGPTRDPPHPISHLGPGCAVKPATGKPASQQRPGVSP